MNSRRISIVFLVMSMSTTQSLLADTQFLPYASIGWASYELELVFPSIDESTKAESTYIVGGLGVVIATGNWYFDANYSSSLNAEAEDDSTEEINFQRTDIRLTIGYFIQENISLFGGYTVGESEFKAYGSGDVITFTASGPYGGIGFNLPHGDNTFSLAAALAVLDSDIETSFLPAESGLTADGFGYSFSAGYNIPLKSDTGIIIKANYQKYDYDNWTSGGIDVDTKAPETLLVLNINYYIGF